MSKNEEKRMAGDFEIMRATALAIRESCWAKARQALAMNDTCARSVRKMD